MFDTIIGSFDHRPTEKEVEEARIIAMNIFGKEYIPDITTDEYIGYDERTNLWLLRKIIINTI